MACCGVLLEFIHINTCVVEPSLRVTEEGLSEAVLADFSDARPCPTSPESHRLSLHECKMCLNCSWTGPLTLTIFSILLCHPCAACSLWRLHLLPGMGGSYRRGFGQIIVTDTVLVIQGKLVSVKQMAPCVQPGHVATLLFCGALRRRCRFIGGGWQQASAPWMAAG